MAMNGSIEKEGTERKERRWRLFQDKRGRGEDAKLCADASSSLRVKRVDHVFNMQTRAWTYKDTKVKSASQVLTGGKTSDGSDVWQSFCFVVVRNIPPEDSPPGVEPTVALTIKSPYLRTACQDVIGDIPGLSWTVDPLELSIDLLVSAYPRFVEYQSDLKKSTDRLSDEDNVLRSLEVLLDYLRTDFQATISQISNLLAHEEISSDLLYAILIPGTLLVTTDPSTGEPCVLQLKSFAKGTTSYTLNGEGLDVIDDPQDNNTDNVSAPAGATTKFGRVLRSIQIPHFRGVVKINTLSAYPMSYHSNEARLKEALLARARKWMKLSGVHHMHYQGTAVIGVETQCGRVYIKYQTDSRTIIDRGAFKQNNANYAMSQPAAVQASQPRQRSRPNRRRRGEPAVKAETLRVKTESQSVGLPDDELILASPVLYGFSLSDKMWLEFNVEKVRPIAWSDEPFTNLVLPGNRRDLLRSLVEAHNSNLDFDDFVQGKGQGLVINLFGPPGVGKTLSAEATSEHLKRPLYMIGGGDLGADANTVDTTLKRVFSIAARWRAIVLIDEADVFLEQRSMHDLMRNAMVAVFLRHVEYYRGILFLTTNRVKAFDPAFLSRIHVALRFQELSKEAKLKIWQAFLQKVKVDDLPSDEIDNLVGREVNGRQIKNATRTATSLAKSRGEKLGYKHLAETLDTMVEFENEFTAISHEM
ncbi:P-loop containing nucleoside triphosphate hydrolase protein [Fomitopsis serialis]|uniref:P-loop containing nucleoside triphosphate hydrolase protein n=1 Tax=Fomitopsis serialis TaxID=139415 RepID=UPI002007974F|nr:P-loop containing nucleoside triphosphate hydrolase protein [Neoantrodia serialis]KAH9931585.1 P-loop containing nucleoside triphosphate hydrolase protein [Neoantrodia serialis]